jgi:hypothetical protein
MVLTAATELGPQKWQESVMTRTAGVSGTMVLVYTSALMFVMRHFAGPLAHQMSPVGMLTVAAGLSAVGLYLLSTATSGVTAFAYATVFGIGIAYFWPTMLGVTAERFPKGGAFLLCVMGFVGNISIAVTLATMGGIYDHYSVQELTRENPSLAQQVIKRDAEALDPAAIAEIPKGSPEAEAVKQAEAVGAAMTFRWVAVMPCILIVIFGAIALFDRARGGYKQVHLSPEKEPEMTPL